MKTPEKDDEDIDFDGPTDEKDDDEDCNPPAVADIWRARTESLGNDINERP